MSLSTRNWVLCLALLQQAEAAEKRIIKEEDVLELMNETPAALAIELEGERARAEAGREGAWPNPRLFLSREESLGATDRFFTVEQTLPLTGRLGLERQAADAAAEAAGERLRLRRLGLRAEVRTAFFDLLAGQRKSTSLREGRDRMEDLVRSLLAREQEGESSGFDRMRAERELAEVEVDLLDARREEDRSRSVLSGLLGVEPGVELVAEGRLEGSLEVPPLEALLALAGDRGDVSALELERQSAELRGRAASRRWIPEPALEVGSRETEALAASDRGTVVSLTLPIPLFNRGQRDAALAEAELALSRSWHQARLRVARAEIEWAHQEVLRSQEAAELYRRSADPEELVRIARLAYDEGEQGILELLDAYRTALAVKLRGLELAAAARHARVRLDLVVGKEVIP